MDPQHPSTRIPNSAIVTTTSPTTTPATTPSFTGSLFNFNITSYRARNSKLARQTSNRTSPRPYSRLPFQSICYTEEGWRSSTSSQPQTIESISSQAAFQNGNNEDHHSTVATGRLFDVNRLKRRIPSCLDSPIIPSSSSVPMASETLPVPCPSFWFKPVSSHFHQSPQASAKMGPAKRNTNYSIPGRSVNPRKLFSAIRGLHQTGISKTNRIRLDCEYSEVMSNPFSTDNSLGPHHQFVKNDDLCSGEEDSKHTPLCIPTSETNNDIMDETGSVYWDCSSHPSWQSTSKISDSPPSLSTKLHSVQTIHSSYTNHEAGINLVDKSIREMERTAPVISTTNDTDLHGRFRSGLRYSNGRQTHSGQMECSRTKTSHQHKRIVNSPENISTCQSTSTSSFTTMHGQYFSDSVYQEVRRHKVDNIERTRNEDLETLLSKFDSTLNLICPIENESSRCTLKSNQPTNRMDLTKTNIRILKSNMGPTPRRSLRLANKSPSTSLCIMELSPASGLDKRIQSEVASHPRSSLHCTSLEPNIDDIATTLPVSPTSNIDNTKLADSTMVPSGTATDHISTSGTQFTRSNNKRRRAVTSENAKMDTLGMEHPRKHRVLAPASTLSSNAIAIISNKTFSTTSQQYLQRQCAYQQWCELRDWDSTSPSAFTLVNYLADNFMIKKWKLSMIETYANSIIMMYPTSDQIMLRQLTVYQDFFQGLRQSSIQPVRSWDYNIQPVIDYILSLGPNSDLSDILLTVKTAWLLAVVGFLRPSDLERIDLDNTKILSNKVLRVLILAPKEKRRGSRITKPITIHPHKNPLLCPVEAFSCYQHRLASSPCRVPHPVFPNITINALFRSIKNYNKAIGSERISKHIKTMMEYVGRPAEAPLPKARALGATLAAQAGVAVDGIVVHRNWSSKSLFEEFYRISVTTSSNFTSGTLDTQQRS